MSEYKSSLPFSADICNGAIFVSYAHKDREKVFPVITRLYEEGWPVWYDEGIEPGSNWKAALSYRICKSAVYLLFISSNSVNSKETIDHELIVAHNFGKNMILCNIGDDEIHLNDFSKLNYASASLIDIPCIDQSDLESALMRIESLRKGKARKAQGVTTTYYASDVPDDADNLYEYEMCSDGVCLTRYLKAFPDSPLIIPREYPIGSGNPVVELRGTFCNKFDSIRIGSLYIPDTVQRIGEKTFFGTSLPYCISVPPSVEIIENNNFALDESRAQDIDMYDRRISIKCAPWSNTRKLVGKVSKGVMIDIIDDPSMAICTPVSKSYASNGNFAFFSYADEDSAEAIKIMKLMNDAGMNIFDCKSAGRLDVLKEIRQCGCFTLIAADGYYASERIEDLYAALAFEKGIAIIEISQEKITKLPDDIEPYLGLSQRLFLDDPDFRFKLIRWMTRNGCKNYQKDCKTTRL